MVDGSDLKTSARKAKFYYDELINNDRTTFSVYLYSDESSSDRIDRNYNQPNVVKEILRGIINENPSMGSAIVWNGSPLNLTSIWANVASSLKNASRNLKNTVNSITNTATQVMNPGGGKVLNWNQDSYYSINEFQKTFGGMTTSTPLRISAILLPYIDKEGFYVDVTTQLTTFLDMIYKQQTYSDGEELMDTESESTSTELKEDKKWWQKLLMSVADGASNTLNWVSDAVYNVANNISDWADKYILTIKPPHGYTGIPLDFIEGQWMANTLAIRIGSRQIYNLLLSNVNVTVSKEMIRNSNGDLSPSQAQIDVTFTPVLVLKPTEIKEYLLDKLYEDKVQTPSGS